MAKVQVADVIVPSVFQPYMLERTAEKSALIQSGIVVPDPRFDALASEGGKLINMPFWQDLSGADEVLSDSSSLTPAKITASQDIASLHARGRAWSANDLAKALAGDDPMARVADLVAEYWNRREQALLVSTLEGVFADNVANDSSDLVSDIASESIVGQGDTTRANGSTFEDALQLLGDSKMKVTGVMMHSAIESSLKKNDLISFIPDSDGKENLPFFQGKRVIVDDTLTVTAGSTDGFKYTCYLFAEGAVARGEGNAPNPVEFDRDILARDDILTNARHFLLHPRGVAFQSASVAGETPTNTECEDATNWDRVWEQKNVGIIKWVVNDG